VRNQLALVDSLAALDDLLGPGSLVHRGRERRPRVPAGRAGSPRRVVLPEGWLDTRDLTAASSALVAEAELDVSGG
jgi:hypothetical protein